MPYRAADAASQKVEAATGGWMIAGIVTTVLFAFAFPVYRWYEPANRAAAREAALASLAAQGAELFTANCASCHGDEGQGVDAPALNSRQFLEAASDEQIASLIAHGVPGTEMAAYGLDFGGFLTSEQIEAITIFLRSLEDEAPDRPDWRFPDGGAGAHDDEEPVDAHDDEEPVDAQDDEPAEAHDDEPQAPVEPDPADAHDDGPAEVHDEEPQAPVEPDPVEPAFDAAAFFAATCAECHGADLSGGDGPDLGPSSHSIGEPDGHLFEAIKFGRREMPAFIDELTDQEIEDIIAFIREVQSRAG